MTDITPSLTAGLVLAGGRSSRFGREKAVETLDGRPLMAWSVAALAPQCAAVAVGARPGSEAETLARRMGLAVLTDDPRYGAGPLRGILAGLEWAARSERELLVTLPCDSPRVGAANVARLIGSLEEAPAAMAATRDGPQPLCAVWRTRLAPQLAAALADDVHPPAHRLLESLGARVLVVDDPSVFANVNTRDDLARIARQ